MKQYRFEITDEDARILSKDNVRITVPLVFPKPRIKAPQGSALKALEELGERIDNDTMKLVTWPSSGLIPNMCGTVLSLTKGEGSWSVELLVQSNVDGQYNPANQKLINDLGNDDFPEKYVCAPDGGQDEETGEVSLHGFTILPSEALRNAEVFYAPVDG